VLRRQVREHAQLTHEPLQYAGQLIHCS
jgi:hypothetical protein